MSLHSGSLEGLQRGFFAVFDGSGETSLKDLADSLLEEQKKTWPGLSRGYAGLEEVRLREIRGDSWKVKIQFNPRRIVSSSANVDPEAIRRRPCFLCPDHLPHEQQAILYRDDYLVLCNPMPIFPGHLTIAHRRHLPQSLPDNISALLRLAADFGPGTTVFYNGPRAGASAPDHLHFQAAPAGLMPAEGEILDPRRRAGAKRREGVEICRTEGLARGMVVIEGSKGKGVAEAVCKMTGLLGRFADSREEPPLNILCSQTGDGWRLILFPRLKHRPDAYFREGEEQILLSPGAVDMGGMLITIREKEFQELNRKLVEKIFGEVAFEDAAVAAMLDLL